MEAIYATHDRAIGMMKQALAGDRIGSGVLSTRRGVWSDAELR